MPIICKIQLDTADFKAQLDSITRLAERVQADTAANAEATAQKVGADAGKAANAVLQAASKSDRDVKSAARGSAESAKAASDTIADGMGNIKDAAENAASGIRAVGNAAEKAAGTAKNGMKAAAGNIKTAAGAASGVVSALGGVSPQLSIIGQALQALLSGPIALVTVAVTALISAATMAWDACTMSAEEYRKKLAAILDLQGKVTDRIREGTETSMHYLNRLEEINRMENKGNAAKAEQARLLETLSKRYGELGIAIDKDTGKMSGFDEARKKILGADAPKLADSLQKQFELKVKQIPQVNVGISSGNSEEIARLEAVLAGYDPDQVKRSYETVSGTMGPSIRRETMSGQKISMRDERAFLADYIENAHISDEGTMDALKARIDALDDILRTADEIARIRASGYATESDEMAALSAATARDQAGQVPNPSSEPDPEAMKIKAVQNGVQAVIERYQMLRREQELIAEGKEREAAIEKETLELRRRAEQMGVELTQEQIDSMTEAVGSWYDYMQSIKQGGGDKADPAALRENLSDQTRDLLDAAKRSVGLDREADTDKAIREAEKAKRGKLDDDERAYVLKLVDLSRTVSGQEEDPLAWKPDLSSRTNELTARGGFSSGAVQPSTEQINKSILSELQKKLTLLGDIKGLLQDGLLT